MNRIFGAGLALCALLGLFDVVSNLMPPPPDAEAPVFIVVAGVTLGVATLGGAVLAWRDKRYGVGTVIVSRVLGALLNVPVYFIDVPTWIRGTVTVLIVLTVAGVAMLIVAPRRVAVG